MRRILKDSLQSDYSILFLCPFLRKKDVLTTISREFASKAVYRKDLTGLIDSIWTKVLCIIPIDIRHYKRSLTCLINLNSAFSMLQ